MHWTDIILFGMRLMVVFVLIALVLEKLCVLETKPTGITKVLYENNLGITLEKRGNDDRPSMWEDISRVRMLYELTRDWDEYRVIKGDATADVPNVVRTEFVEKTNYEPDCEWWHKATVRVLKATLVEEERTSRYRIGTHQSKTFNHRIQNKMVIEYEITNKDEIERRKREKQRDVETLQQFTTLKGDM